MEKQKTILFVMPRLPFPASSGRKTSLYHYCRILSRNLGYKLIVAAFLEEGDDPAQKPDFIDKLVVLPKPEVKTKIKNIIKDSIILRNKPMQVSLYWNPKAKKVIDEICNQYNLDYVIGDMVRSTEYIKNINAIRIADLDDRISLRYQRQLDTDVDNVNPYGAFLRTVPKWLQKVMLLKPLKMQVMKSEISLLKKYEIEIGKCCDRTLSTRRRLPRINSSRARISPLWTRGKSCRIRSLLMTGSVEVSTPQISTLPMAISSPPLLS